LSKHLIKDRVILGIFIKVNGSSNRRGYCEYLETWGVGAKYGDNIGCVDKLSPKMYKKR
jgi:hypothetical protein